MIRADFTSTVSNRKALRVDFCFYEPALISNLEHSWHPQQRRM